MPRYGPGMLDRYGDLSAGFRVGRGIGAGRSEDDSASMADGDALRPRAWMMQRTRNDITAAYGKRLLSAVADAKRTQRCGTRCR